MNPKTIEILLLACAHVMPFISAPARAESDALKEGFFAPPDSAKPRVWWQWMNGNVTEEGVRLDLEWMKRIGIGGVQQFDVAFAGWGGALDTPQIVSKPLAYLSPEWRRAMRYSVGLASQLGLEFSIASSPGWSGTGGPWVEPRKAMKKLVWSETLIKGGVAFKGRLAQPPQVTGPFQNLPWTPVAMGDVGHVTPPMYYSNVATIAYRVPGAESMTDDPEVQITSSAGTIDATQLSDGDLFKSVQLPFGPNGQAWIKASFPRPRRIWALTLALGAAHMRYEFDERGRLEASGDGRTFHKVLDLPQKGALEQTLSFPPIVARHFRLILERPERSRLEAAGLRAAAEAHSITEFVLHHEPRVHRFEDKAGFSSRAITESDDTPSVKSTETVRLREIVDLTNRVSGDGSLDWTPPEGLWRVLRFGYSLTGSINVPAARAGTGLEVDKLDRASVKHYMNAYLSEYEKALGVTLAHQHDLRYVVTDSYESGPQNWTDDMLAKFKQRRGYDALPWMPVLAGRVVESAVSSDRFLWDFRKTIAELMAEAYYGQLSESLHEHGMGRYGEAHEAARAFVGDGIEAKKTADVPMGAMWAFPPETAERAAFEADIRESAAVAHIYGQNVVAAEAFTALGNSYGFSPRDLKPMADRMLAMGLNRFVIHTSAHQPDTALGPGLGLGPFGQWFTRKETWAEQAGPWITYLTRSSYLLQQGRSVADIAYLYGEDTNVASLFSSTRPAVPAGYSFDFINADALLNEISAQNGRLMTRSGMEYRVLVLDPSVRRMTVPVLQKIRELVYSGVIVLGSRPDQTPSLADDPHEFDSMVAQLWGGSCDQGCDDRRKIYANVSLETLLQSLHIPPDLLNETGVGAPLRFVHRRLINGGELYFISSDDANSQRINASFRVSGRKPELWRADTGSIAPLPYRFENGRTRVTLHLDGNDAVFVVFRAPAIASEAVIAKPAEEVLTTFDGAWDVSFPAGRGAPIHERFAKLESWTHDQSDGVKYFSGTATYSKTIRIPRKWLKGHSQIDIDFGEVLNLAETRVNGQLIGVAWHRPFRLDATGVLKPGINRIEVKVSNLWPNRLIGDRQPGARKIAYAAFDPFSADAPLLPSGLLGPVRLIRSSKNRASG